MFSLSQKIRLGCYGVTAFMIASAAIAQQSSTAPEDSFSLEAAILDTSIPFAVGAHEARQELRGAFGWPTFQEGLVQGVYFRFDPDGYARFSPTPRLDTDVFEVICRPRTHVCMARKDSLTLTQNSRNQIQIQLENVTEADEFLIAEGISELPIPNNILQPLDARMELLLSTGGDLVVSRGKKEVDRISLKGFAAVTSYLRWVAAEQSYTVLPRDWPVPNSGTSQAEITRPANWTSPMPKPAISEPQVQDAEVAEVRGELRILRELLLKGEQPTPTKDHAENDRLRELQYALDALAQEIEGLKIEDQPKTIVEFPVIATNPLTDPELPKPEDTSPVAESSAQQMARRMEYLMTEIGLEPEVALMLLKQGKTEMPLSIDETSPNVVDDLLTELRAKLPKEAASEKTVANVSIAEYQLLTDYFQSVFEHP